jgi:hypothetical protein
MDAVASTVATPPARTTPSRSKERRENRVDHVLLMSGMEIVPHIDGNHRLPPRTMK